MTREHSLHLYKTWESKSLECRALFQQNTFFIAYSSMCQEYMGKKRCQQKRNSSTYQFFLTQPGFVPMISCVAEHNEKPHPLSGTDSPGEYQISLESKMLLFFSGSVT